VEAHLQVLLADRPDAIRPGLTLVRREYETGIGPVDLLCRDADGSTVAVEVKRRGEIDGVEQLTRYLARLHADPLLPRPVRGILVAQSITPQARLLAADRGMDCVTVDYDVLRGLEPSLPTLF
jgi:RecB family endonuclease NucS